MTYFILAPIFFLTLTGSLIWGFVVVFAHLFKKSYFQNFYLKYYHKINRIYFIWLCLYLLFILFFTGPKNLNQYPPQASSPYKLPWADGVNYFVAQGNQSFTSHRGHHEYAWDFVMPISTSILASRKGRVVDIQDQFDGIGFNSNYISVEHEDGTRAVYAHIQKNGARMHLGDTVLQGQPIALSGMVGQTIFPHLHFYVVGASGQVSMPISFNDVINENSQTGVPLAGRFYTSQNTEQKSVINY